MKKVIVLVSTLLFASLASAEFKMAYVDIHQAIEKSAMGKKAKDEMKKEAEKKNKELEKKKADLDKMGEDIEKKKSVLSEEALQKRGQEFQMEAQKFRETVSKAQAELAKKENELLEPIVTKVKSVIEKISKEKGISMVIQSNQNAQIVLYANAESNLTDEVVKALEKDSK